MESSGIVTYPSDSSGDEMEREETRMPSVNQPPGEPQFIYHLHSKNKEEAERMYQQVLMNKETRRLEREEREKEMKEREEEARRIADKIKKERQERRRRREEEEKKEEERRAKEENERMEEEKRNEEERRLMEEEAKANKKRKEELKRREEEIDRREREIKRRGEELEKKEKQTEKRLKEKEEEGRLKMEREWKEKEEKRLKEANEEEERREKEYRRKKEDLKKREEKMREEGMAEIENVKEKLEEERANLEREMEELNRNKEEMKQKVRQEIEDVLRKERLRVEEVEEELRRKVEGEIEGKWKKRVEEVDSWWKTQNSELKGEWEYERVEWEREKAKNVKEMEEMRWKLVEEERLRMQLEEKNRRLELDAELQREKWNRETEKNRRESEEEKNNMTRKWQEKLNIAVDEAKKAERMEMEETISNMLENYGREIMKFQEDLEMKDIALNELQRKLDATSSKYQDEIYEIYMNHQIKLNKLENEYNLSKNILSSKINELDDKERVLSIRLKELNELQRWTVSEVRRFAGYRTEYYSQLASQQRPKHSDALDSRVVPYSHNVRRGMSGDICGSLNARQKAVERKEEFIGELERKWIEYVHQVKGKLEDFEKNGKSGGKSKTKIFTNAYSKTASLFSFMSDVASAVVGSVEEHEDLTNSSEVHDALNQDDGKVLSISNGKGNDSEKYPMQDLSNYGSLLHGSNYDPLAGITCSSRGQSEEVMNTDQDVDMNVTCGDLCRDVVKKEVKSTNHGEDFEVAIGGRTCESASVNGKNSHIGCRGDSSQDWLVVTEREYNNTFHDSVIEMNEKYDREIMELRKQIEKHEGEMMKLRKELEVMRETNPQYQLQSNDQSSEVLSSNEGNVFREGGEELGGDELRDRKNR